MDADDWLDREEAMLDRQLAAEMIAQKEYDAMTISLRAEYREMLRDREFGH